MKKESFHELAPAAPAGVEKKNVIEPSAYIRAEREVIRRMCTCSDQDPERHHHDCEEWIAEYADLFNDLYRDDEEFAALVQAHGQDPQALDRIVERLKTARASGRS